MTNADGGNWFGLIEALPAAFHENGVGGRPQEETQCQNTIRPAVTASAPRPRLRNGRNSCSPPQHGRRAARHVLSWSGGGTL